MPGASQRDPPESVPVPRKSESAHQSKPGVAGWLQATGRFASVPKLAASDLPVTVVRQLEK